jgi:hypothetical protein
MFVDLSHYDSDSQGGKKGASLVPTMSSFLARIQPSSFQAFQPMQISPLLRQILNVAKDRNRYLPQNLGSSIDVSQPNEASGVGRRKIENLLPQSHKQNSPLAARPAVSQPPHLWFC